MILCRILLFLYLINASLGEDYYELLGIRKNAENREIRQAFKKLALIYHPDKNKGKEDAHEKFIAINKAYEVLKDEEMRKKYDLYGEDGLKEDLGNKWKGNYHSWNYYQESFGIYDDDPEIVTLSHSDFERFVLDSPDMWFVNYYSPHCSHCHILAPTWRQLARELQNVIQIGAVNCEEDWMLCRRQNVYSYPSLILYSSSEKTKYKGSREAEDMIEYVLQKLPYKVIELNSLTYESILENKKKYPLPWLVFSCKGNECVSKDNLKKLGIILEHLVHVGEIESIDHKKLCNWLDCKVPVSYFTNLTTLFPYKDLKKVVIDDLEVNEIVNRVLHLLPGLPEISSEDLKKIIKNFHGSYPWLIQFTREEMSSSEEDIHLKRLASLLPGISLGHFNCFNDEAACKDLYIFKFPTFILFREDSTYEFYHGRIATYDIARFALEASFSRVETLTAKYFPKFHPESSHQVTSPKEIWFIDFFAPWCPPCINFLSEFRKVSQRYKNVVNFGTVDCAVHISLCRSYNIQSYPSAILYKDSIGYKFHGQHSQFVLNEFIEDVLHPVVVSLTPESFQEIFIKKAADDIWVIDFFAPWCGPCQELAPQWRKLAKMLKQLSHVHIGEVDCQTHNSFCGSLGVNSYPTIRLYPRGSTSTGKFFSYNGWYRDASSLQAWVHSFLPSKVRTLSDTDFQKVLADSKPWVIDFFAPWCTHCQIFAPEFEKIAQTIEGKVKAGKVNCDVYPKTCMTASISAYPTVVFYKGKTSSKTQNPVGEEIHPFTFDAIILFLEKELDSKFKKLPRDEL